MRLDTNDAAATARELVTASNRVVVVTGAGISTASGIPDFRGPEGVWTKNPATERLATIDHYANDPDARRRAWRSRLESRTWVAEPNAGHRALVELEAQGKLEALITQNVDGLHLLAGSDPSKVIELHGTMRDVICMSCDDRGPAEATLERVRRGEEDPECLRCGGILKSATVSFGQSLDVGDLSRATDAVQHCDLLLAIGSSLVVYPAAGLVPMAASEGADVIIVNAQPTPYDQLARVLVRDPIEACLPCIVAALRA